MREIWNARWQYVLRFGIWLQKQAEARIGFVPLEAETTWGESEDGRVWRLPPDEARRSS